MSRDRLYVVAACLLVVAGVAAGFAAIGSPAHARQLRADQQRVEDLSTISKALHTLYSGRLPPALPHDLATQYYDQARSGAFLLPKRDFTRDPQTHQPYPYLRIGSNEYRLCATFAIPSEAEEGADRPPPGFWAHDAGRKCYSLDARKI